MSDFRRLNEIKRWRARFSVNPELVNVDRTELVEDEQVAVFQHTLEDYDYMLGQIYRLSKALENVVVLATEAEGSIKTPHQALAAIAVYSKAILAGGDPNA